VTWTQVVIGTHGRLKGWVTRRQLDIDHVNILVFDEADEMLKADAFSDDSGGFRPRARMYTPEWLVVVLAVVSCSGKGLGG
jgi:hypothetical protein